MGNEAMMKFLEVRRWKEMLCSYGKNWKQGDEREGEFPVFGVTYGQ